MSDAIFFAILHCIRLNWQQRILISRRISCHGVVDYPTLVYLRIPCIVRKSKTHSAPVLGFASGKSWGNRFIHRGYCVKFYISVWLPFLCPLLMMSTRIITKLDFLFRFYDLEDLKTKQVQIEKVIEGPFQVTNLTQL